MCSSDLGPVVPQRELEAGGFEEGPERGCEREEEGEGNVQEDKMEGKGRRARHGREKAHAHARAVSVSVSLSSPLLALLATPFLRPPFRKSKPHACIP